MKVPIIVTMLTLMASPVYPQRISGSSATSVAAELIKGKLSPADSRPGDQITVRLKEDVKSNGDIVLKKGTTITGIVRHASRPEGKAGATEPEFAIEVEWLAPTEEVRPRELMIAVQSVTQISPVGLMDSGNETDATTVQSRASRGQGLVNETSAHVTNQSSASNTALLNMPSVVAADPLTATELQKSLGTADGQPLFQTGHGLLVSPGGYKDSIDIFSYLNNDTVLTSRSRSFELSSGAQLRLLVGMHKK
jgi:hypothetical protein